MHGSSRRPALSFMPHALVGKDFMYEAVYRCKKETLSSYYNFNWQASPGQPLSARWPGHDNRQVKQSARLLSNLGVLALGVAFEESLPGNPTSNEREPVKIMQSVAWKAIFNRIPREHHEILMVVTSIGIEINVKSIQLPEPDYVVIRGRLGGTTDAGRLFFVPYDQINYVTFNKEIREEHIAEMLGTVAPPPKAAIPDGEGVKQQDAAAAAAASAKEEPAPTPAPEPAKALPRQMALLERIRAASGKPEGEGPGSAPITTLIRQPLRRAYDRSAATGSSFILKAPSGVQAVERVWESAGAMPATQLSTAFSPGPCPQDGLPAAGDVPIALMTSSTRAISNSAATFADTGSGRKTIDLPGAAG